MGKACGVKKRRAKARKMKFNHKNKMAKAKNKLLKRPKIENAILKEAWQKNKTRKKNLEEFGLSYNPNTFQKLDDFKKKKRKSKSKVNKTEIIEKLENIRIRDSEKSFPTMSGALVKLCSYFIEKYGEDYKAMQRDPQNYYQLSEGQIKDRIKHFKSNPTLVNAYNKAVEMCEEQMEDE